MQQIWPARPARRVLGSLVATLVLGAVAGWQPQTVHAQANTCNGFLSISYPQVEPFNTMGSIDTVRLAIGAGAIDGGTTLTVEELFFGLDCRNKGCTNNAFQNCNVNSDCDSGQACFSLLPGCLDDGEVAGFVEIVGTTCTVDETPVEWTADTSTQNKVVFSASPSIVIPANTSSFCSIDFKIQKLSMQSNDSTPLTIEQNAGFESAECDTQPKLGTSTTINGSLNFDPTPTPTPTATSTPTSTPTPTPASVCGDGIVEHEEQCDPGEYDPDGCCDAECQLREPGSACDGDSNACTVDTCDEEGHCVFVEELSEETPCSEGDLCTQPGLCIEGACVSEPVDCDDGFECTVDSCHPVVGCLNVATVESSDCPGSCSDGLNNDPENNDWIDFEDPACSPLAPLSRLTIVASEAKRRTDLIAAVDATVARKNFEAFCDSDTSTCACPRLACSGAGKSCSADSDCIDGVCGAGGVCECPELDCALGGQACTNDAQCLHAVAGFCDGDLGLCLCPESSPGCHALYRPCSTNVDCAVAPFPTGKSAGGVCANGLHIAAGSQVGFWATRTTARFGAPREVIQRDATMELEFANAGGKVTIPNQQAPLVGPIVCSNDMSQPCDSDADCPGGTCDARNRLLDGSIFESFDGEVGAGLDGTGTSLNFKLCDNAMTILSPTGPRLREPALLQLEVEAVPATTVLGPANCIMCRSVTAADDACIPCPEDFSKFRTGGKGKKVIITLDGGLHVIDLKRIIIAANSVLEIRGQAETTVVIRSERAVRVGARSRVVLASNGTDNGIIVPSRVLWVATGGVGGRIQVSNGSVFRGTLLATARRGVRVGKETLVQGAIYTKKVSLGKNCEVQHYPFTALLP